MIRTVKPLHSLYEMLMLYKVSKTVGGKKYVSDSTVRTYSSARGIHTCIISTKVVMSYSKKGWWLGVGHRTVAHPTITHQTELPTECLPTFTHDSGHLHTVSVRHEA